jgi:peptide/nickel transport system ATP-binding protein/oligopeptide transport system ATP-binding protein
MTTVPLLDARDLIKTFPMKPSGRVLTALDGVNLRIDAGDILGVVGESGCGKSTLGRILAGIIEPTEGNVVFEGTPLADLPAAARRRTRARLQYVYQDPGAALDPRWTIGRSLAEPLVAHTNLTRTERTVQVAEMASTVGLRPEHLHAYPHELSGGQQRRVALARVLTLHPALVILDEPTAGLDVSVRATILRLFRDLAAAFHLTYVFISHDLAVVRRLCTRVAVMYLGRVVETGPTNAVFADPCHPYTRSLIDATPQPRGRRVIETAWLDGEPPDPADIPSGCRFNPRCPLVQPDCRAAQPTLLPFAGTGHAAACFRAPHYPGNPDV